MKTTVYFKQFLPALATLVTVGFASSCQDQNFDWDDAHAITAQAKFTNTFIKAYGKPAEGHQWGFDMSWDNQNNSKTRSIDKIGEGSGRIVKLEDKPAGPDEWAIAESYGTVPAITDQEHEDVYAWFSAHRVTWDNTTEKIGHINDEDFTYQFLDSNGTDITSQALAAGTEGFVYTGSVKKKNKNTNAEVGSWEGKICINSGGTAGTIVKLVSFNPSSPSNTRNSNGGTAVLIDGGETLLSNTHLKSEFKSTDAWPVGMSVSFNYAWIQHVASTKYATNGKDELGIDYDEQSVCPENESDYFNYDSDEMNYMEIFGTDRKHEDLENYNNGLGPGYGWTGGNKPVAQLMGVLGLGIDFNQLSYLNSIDGNNFHDKWYIVYLEGGTGDQKYAGWYLGFDLEGAKECDASGQFAANGICNDWIIKLTSVATKPEKGRIMCEDLGGINNRVDVDGTVHISDIDYNDVVIDFTPVAYRNDTWVEYDGTDAGADFLSVKLTLRAAGGTLPLTVWYGDMCLFETHELFQEGMHYNDANHTSGIDYSVMYRTNADNGNDTAEQRSFIINLSKYYVPENIIRSGNKIVGYEFDRNNSTYTPFDVNKIHLRVWRHSAEDYIKSSGSSYSEADWITLTNYEGDAPLKICVPQSVKWLKERKSIDSGYPSFMNWVKDPSNYFWNKSDIVSGNLYN